MSGRSLPLEQGGNAEEHSDGHGWGHRAGRARGTGAGEGVRRLLDGGCILSEASRRRGGFASHVDASRRWCLASRGIGQSLRRTSFGVHHDLFTSSCGRCLIHHTRRALVSSRQLGAINITLCGSPTGSVHARSCLAGDGVGPECEAREAGDDGGRAHVERLNFVSCVPPNLFVVRRSLRVDFTRI